MPMGISSAPEIYQRAMYDTFEGIEFVEIAMDDILVQGSTQGEHSERLIKVLDRAREVNLKQNAKNTK